MNAEQVFLNAVDKDSDAERDRYLEYAFALNPGLRSEVVELLRAHDEAGEFLSKPLVDPLPRLADSRIDSLPPDSMVGPYQIVREIGRGGMGVVYLALDPRLGRPVALKVLASERASDSQWVARFRREARAASALNHPGILTIHEIGEADGIHYLATEFVEGTSLRERMKTGSLSRAEAIDIATQVAGAMARAHSSGIVHRDLKPDNLMLRDDGLVKILDFGLAKVAPAMPESPGRAVASSYVSEPGLVMGTANFMSPEQARGQETDRRTDVFSFGILLFQMLAGQHPFKADSAPEVMAAILDRAPAPLSGFVSDIPATLTRLVHRCLNKDRGGRPSFPEIVQELQELRPATERTDSSPASPAREESESGKSSSANQDLSRATLSGLSTEFGVPPVHYARSGDLDIAWQSIGSGPIDVVFVMGWVSHLEWFWREPSFARFLRRLATFSRVILFDKRGTGLSDKVPVDKLPTLEQRIEDVRAVMDAAGSKRAVLCGVSEGGPMCTLFAATFPEKTVALVMLGCYARRLWAEDYPWGPTAAQRDQFLELIRREWGGPVGIEERAPSRASDPAFREWWASYLRMGASPGAAVALTRMNALIDVRPILSGIQVPTLVVHRSGDRCLRVEEGRYLASRIPGAKYVELPGNDHLPFAGDQDSICDEIQEFLTGVRQLTPVDKVLLTVVSMIIETIPGAPMISQDQAGSPAESAELEASNHASGQSAPATGATTGPYSGYWRFAAMVAKELALFRGENVNLALHSVEATFDGPARAVRAGIAVRDLARRLGVNARLAVHTGQCEIRNGRAAGVPVDLAAQMARLASIDQVLVSDTVKNLVSGSGLELAETGMSVEENEARKIDLFEVIRAT